MGRAIGAVIVAEVVWSVLWLGGSMLGQVLWPGAIRMGEPITHSGVLAGFIGYGVVVSAVSGYIAAMLRGEPAMKTVWIFAWIQLVIGIGVETSGWSMAPTWYHLVFLAMLVPAVVWGGTLRAGGRESGLAAA